MAIDHSTANVLQITDQRPDEADDLNNAPINVIDAKLAEARATLDLVYTIAQGDEVLFEQLEKRTLCEAMHTAIIAIDEASDAAARLNNAAHGERAAISSGIYPGYSDDTAPRIRAYLDSVQPLRGVADVDIEPCYQRGRALIERLARSARGDKEPKLRLTVSQCADIIRFLERSEPATGVDWMKEPDDRPSHLVGQHFVLGAVVRNLRGKS